MYNKFILELFINFVVNPIRYNKTIYIKYDCMLKVNMNYFSRFFISLLFLTLLTTGAYSVNNINAELTALNKWQTGDVVSIESVNHFGLNRCFCSCNIDDAIFKRIYSRSYKKVCTVPKSSLRYIKVLHYTLNGKIKIGEIICNKVIAKDLVEIFRDLFAAHYPIERMVLIDEYNADDELSMSHNNTSCFNFRAMTGGKNLSKHAKGLAIDINPLYNPYVKINHKGILVKPKNGKAYADRSHNFSYKIDRKDLCYRLFIKHGFHWGGAWRSHQDYQHFEK